MPYKAAKKPLPEIAQQLGVDKIVEGSVLRSGDRVRISAQLIHGPTDRHLWARSYERNIRDVLSLQSDLAAEIAREIRTALRPEDKAQLAVSRPVDPEVYELFLKGQYEYNLGTRDSIRKSIEFEKQAIAKDPGYAPAYAALNEGYMWLDDYHIDPESEIREPAKAAALRAVELDERLPEAHAALGHFYVHNWNWPEAEREFKRALELNPGYTTATFLYGIYLRTLGRLDEALEYGRRVRELEPLSLRARSATIKHLYVARDYEAALREARSLQEIYPNATAIFRHFGEIYAATGEYDKAIEALRSDPALRSGHPMALARLGYAYGKSGATRDALKILEDLKNTDARRPVPAEIAYVYLGLSDTDRAFEWIEKAFALKSEWLVHTKFDPVFDGIRSDPRFRNLLMRIGIPP
jgi:tetratricopeptide (TPR) repeat protein